MFHGYLYGGSMTKHMTKRERSTGICACGCGTELPQVPGSGRPRKWADGHDPNRRRTGKPVGRPKKVDDTEVISTDDKPTCTHLLKKFCGCPK